MLIAIMLINASLLRSCKALLEKAMKSRRTSTDGNNAEIDTAIINGPGQIVAEKSPGSAPAAPHFLAPTKAFKVQSVVRTAKQVV